MEHTACDDLAWYGVKKKIAGLYKLGQEMKAVGGKALAPRPCAVARGARDDCDLRAEVGKRSGKHFADPAVARDHGVCMAERDRAFSDGNGNRTLDGGARIFDGKGLAGGVVKYRKAFG